MPAANHHKSRYGPRTLWTTGTIIVVCSVAVVLGLAVFVLFDSDSTTAGEEAAVAIDPAGNTVPTANGSTCVEGQSFYVAPAGRPGNSGSIDAPLDLAMALSDKSPAKACDTIWLRSGTYKGAFNSVLKGAEGKPIIVRQYPGERATLDSAGKPEPTLLVDGSWTWYWGFELTNSEPQRSSQEGGAWPSDLKRGTGVGSRGTNIKFINLVVHDAARGIEVNADSINTEIYGSLIYYNGWGTPAGGAQGNGIETQNQVGTRRIADNIIFSQFSHGLIASGKPLDNIIIEGNTFFSNGNLSQKGVLDSRNILLGAGVITNRPVVTDNAIYDGQTNLGYDAGCADATVTGNYFVGPLIWVKCAGVMKDNILYNPYESGSGYGQLPAQFPANTYHKARPTGVIVRVRPNEYAAGPRDADDLQLGQNTEGQRQSGTGRTG